MPKSSRLGSDQRSARFQEATRSSGSAAVSAQPCRTTTMSPASIAAFSSPAGDLPGTIEVFAQAPNKSRTLLKLDLSVAGMGTATVDQRFDGESGYVIDSLQGNRDITGNQLENLKNAMFPSPFLNYKERGGTVEFVTANVPMSYPPFVGNIDLVLATP